MSGGTEAEGSAPLEKRGNVRDPSRRPVRLRIHATDLRGLTRDASRSGAYVLAAEDLEVECEIDGEPAARPGRIVRIELLPGGGVGIAVEFR